MSSWAHDPERAADALIRRSFDVIAWRGRILLANQAGALPSLLAERGLAVELWNRRLGGEGRAEPWPPTGPFDLVLLRLPKAKDEQEMATHACLSVLAADGRLILYGGNDEGIRSAAAMLEELAGRVETLAARGHGRVVAAGRPPAGAGLRAPLAAWHRTVPLAIGGITRDWVTYPGLFAADRIDDGTALLLSALPALSPGASALDYGCGSGVIGAAVRAANPGLALDLLDNDAVALTAARENVRGARLILARRLGHAGKTAYDAILSNPPLHRGIAEDHGELEQLIAEAPAHLNAGGLLQIVVQRRVPLDRLLAGHFAEVQIVAQDGRYRVWRAHISRSFAGRESEKRHGEREAAPQPANSCAASNSAAPPATPMPRLRLKPK
jgi:16S rRNA (guanine1207-N2)-methyltransferase